MRILIVCHGNICRSPMAEGILKNKLEKANKHYIMVESAGFEPYHDGDEPDSRAQATMKKHHIDISKQRARLFNVSDFDEFDHIYFMDENNLNYLKSFARNQFDLSKTDFILNATNPNKNYSVPDPYYGGNDGFEMVFKLLDAACEKISKTL
jgi:protein-tyrosine phosphatase